MGNHCLLVFTWESCFAETLVQDFVHPQQCLISQSGWGFAFVKGSFYKRPERGPLSPISENNPNLATRSKGPNSWARSEGTLGVAQAPLGAFFAPAWGLGALGWALGVIPIASCREDQGFQSLRLLPPPNKNCGVPFGGSFGNHQEVVSKKPVTPHVCPTNRASNSADQGICPEKASLARALIVALTFKELSDALGRQGMAVSRS